ncbi:MAG: hypothetical protein GWN00_12110, partial [Aliifodinibius sp.]|nr:hypothetical protein [Fodinibius sp.]NIV11877.1 hypothetical protein [Fodinibius sp.]NIY25524.1 hypothetical protein [Fodinibius sp.]
EYIAYDSEGRLLELRVQKTQTGFGPERVVLSCPEAEPTHSAELKQLLMSFFICVGVDKAWVSKASLEELVARGIRDYKTT